MSDNNDALFREVDEEVRNEEYQKLWTKYGKYFTGVAVGVIALVAAYQGWKHYQHGQAEAAGGAYFEALKKATAGKSDDALAALAAVKNPGYETLGKLEAAAILAGKGETEKAVAAYDAFAADPANDKAFADLARIRAGYLLADTQTPDQLLARLGPFDKDDALWHNEAREIFGLAAWRTKDFAMANRYFNAIMLDAKATQGLKQRAQLMLQLIAPNLAAK